MDTYKEGLAVMSLFPCQRHHGFRVLSLKPGDESSHGFPALLLGLIRHFLGNVEQTLNDEFFQRGFTLSGNDFGLMKQFVREIQSRFHGAIHTGMEPYAQGEGIYIGLAHHSESDGCFSGAMGKVEGGHSFMPPT